ncbi:MAG: undecaprenyldiphospho-muramoylpentapeptide beta-N-acetylglucosaminyltransferase [Salinisphaera sp.]|nr:undecaprenyldiphospho-muramoylpentapeptide beta-N-acetylglucosaminyltransferase [Salinisphaera sp.]
MSGLRVLMMAGGTGGHVFPALAVADALRERGAEVVWLGTRAGLEARVVPDAGYRMEWLQVAGLRGKGAASWLAAPWRLVRALAHALAIVRRVAPQVVVGMGGFVSGPGGLAAWLLRRPLLIHEQNATAGLTNRLLARLARRRMQAFPGALPNARTVGNPVRAEILALPSPAQRFAGRVGRVRLLVIGGSGGALALNRLLPAALARVPAQNRPEVRHQGGRTLQAAQQAYAEHDIDAQLCAFIDDMSSAYAWADLAVCRAGALTVAELAAAGLGALLVPFPFAVDDHQSANAAWLVERGAALMVAERELDPECLAATLAELCADRRRLQVMAEAARAAAWPDATGALADACVELAA